MIKKRGQLLHEVLDIKEFIRGSLVKTKRKCGRKSCRCEQGQLHPHVYISTSRNKRNKIIYIRPNEEEKARQYINNYRKLIRILDQISQLNAALLKVENQD